MSPKNRKALQDRVSRAAEAALHSQGYVSAVDVLLGMGWLDRSGIERWRRRQCNCLERVVMANLSRISEAMRLFRKWAAAKGLAPSETVYVSHTRDRRRLRFSVSGDHTIERLYRTHWVSPAQSAQKRERREEEAKRAGAGGDSAA